MPRKEHILVIAPDKNVPENLHKAIESMDLPSSVCSFNSDIAQKVQAEQASVAVLAGEKLDSLDHQAIQPVISQLDDLSVQTLLLANEIMNSKMQLDGVMRASSHETPEMLKGRLATLVAIQPELERLEAEIRQLQMVNVPLNTQFLQVDEEMRVASRLQRDFLPRELPDVSGIQFAAIWRPASWVSGDIYDITRLDEDHVGFYVADAVGHGMPAALLTIFIKRALVTKRIEANSYTLIDPGFVLSKLNDDIVEQELSSFQFVTASYGILNIKTFALRIASAGHPQPMRIPINGVSEELDVSGSLLGVFPDQRYETQTFQLEPGDKLLLYSDGVEEAFINQGPDEPLRFRKEFGDLSRYDLQTMCDKLLSVIDLEEGSLHPRDDVTIIGIEIDKT